MSVGTCHAVVLAEGVDHHRAVRALHGGRLGGQGVAGDGEQGRRVRGIFANKQSWWVSQSVSHLMP